MTDASIVTHFIKREQSAWDLDTDGAWKPRGIGLLKCSACVYHVGWLRGGRRVGAINQSPKDCVDNFAQLAPIKLRGLPAPFAEVALNLVERCKQ